jgi:hypothetical protein
VHLALRLERFIAYKLAGAFIDPARPDISRIKYRARSCMDPSGCPRGASVELLAAVPTLRRAGHFGRGARETQATHSLRRGMRASPRKTPGTLIRVGV